MKSKTLIGKQLKRKRNPWLVKTILFLKKSNQELAGMLSKPARKRICINLDEIDKQAKDNETIIVPGKVLGQGDIDKNKKINIIAFSFSESAKDKLKKSKIVFSTILEQIEKNKKLEGRILE